MSYTFELYFTGLCCFHVLPDAEEPKRVRVLLVNARGGGHGHHEGHEDHQHWPYLSVAVRNLVHMGSDPPAPARVVPAPDAMDCALFDLTGEEAFLESDEAAPLSLKRGRSTPDKPPRPEARQWWDWVARLRRLDPRVKGLKQECLQPPKPGGAGLVAAAVEVPFGELGTFELGSRGKQLFFFEFRRYDGQPADAATGNGGRRCLADRLVLRAENLEQPVVVRMGEQIFGIGPDSLPASGTVKASVTNIRTQYRSTRPPAVKDFERYYSLVDWNGPAPPQNERIIPWVTQTAHGGHTPSTGSCPPSDG